MDKIPFTQFLRPRGQRRQEFIERPKEILDKAEKLIKAGCRFEIEELMSGMINMDCQKADIDGPISMEVCSNGPAIENAVDRLVNNAYKQVFKE
jgi:hypothetical protein